MITQNPANGFGAKPSVPTRRAIARVAHSPLAGFWVIMYGRFGVITEAPAEVVSTEVVPVLGNPDPKRICTSHIERQNLSIRMGMRRMTRLTNGFSKKWENLKAAYALWFAFYNFCRVHKTLRVTPAMEAGIADRVWGIADLLA